jgi:hypothetical protein
VLSARGLYGKVRLACQLVCNRELRVRPLMTKERQGWPNTGPAPESTVTPEPRWLPRAQLEAAGGAGDDRQAG